MLSGRARGGAHDRLDGGERVLDPVMQFADQQRLLRLGLLALLDLVLGVAIEAAVLERDGGLRRQAREQALRALREHLRPLVPEDENAMDLAGPQQDGNRHEAADHGSARVRPPP